ncbi:uncharacterized protein [Henckelia pumila]|uniref:uncharacterized protein n=1 Tax=Henckelia pumila TaxID=405737 RepID=UPI003C6DE278
MVIETVVATTLQGLINPNANQPPPPPPEQNNGTKQHYESLRRARVPTFDGSSDSEAGQNWMKEIENHIRLLKVPQEFKVEVITPFLVDKATKWWEGFSPAMLGTRPFNWKSFHEAFLKQYFPQLFEYRNEALKMHRFKKRLNNRIQYALVVIEPSNYDELIGAAIRAENNIKRREGENKLKHLMPSSTQPSQGQQFKKPKYTSYPTSSSHNKGTQPTPPSKERQNCPNCGFCHSGEFHKGTGSCFRCGKLYHHIAQCTLPNPMNVLTVGTPSNKPKENNPNTMVHVLTQEKADNSNDVVASTILINKIPAYVLFYCGAMHSFMAKRFAKKIGVKPDNLEEPYRVATPANQTLETQNLYRDVSIRIETKEFKADLIQLNMVEFDVVKERKTLLYASQTWKALKKGKEFYLSIISEVKMEAELRIENIPVVREFPDVFPEELPGKTSDREIIKLKPRTTPISKAPYQMAPEKLKELEDQLQELLDKKQI